MKKVIVLLSFALLVATSCSNEKINEEEKICITNFPTVRVSPQDFVPLPGGNPELGSPGTGRPINWSPSVHYTFGSGRGGIVLVAEEWDWDRLFVTDNNDSWLNSNLTVQYIRATDEDTDFIEKAISDWFEIRMVTSQKVVVRLNPNTLRYERKVYIQLTGSPSPEGEPFVIIEITQSAE